MSHSYKVNGGGYSSGSSYPPPHYAYGQHEMTEYSNGRTNGSSYSTAKSAKNNGSGYPAAYGSHQRNASVSHVNNAGGNGGNGGGTVAAGALDDDDEFDRGHWGSKAEFILSCVGFSVRILLFHLLQGTRCFLMFQATHLCCNVLWILT